MYYRTLAALIVVFWTWMTVWLLRTEWLPEGRNEPSIPVGYLWKLMFLHQESSDLILYSGGQRLGSFQLQPHQQTSGGGKTYRLLKVLGGFNVQSPWISRLNIVLHGTLEFDETDQVQRVEIAAAVHEPKQPAPGRAIVLDGRPAADQWHYSVSQGGALVTERTGTVAELLDTPELRAIGLDPTSLGKIPLQSFGHITVSAHREKMRINGDDIDAYALSLQGASGLQGTVHLNQLGQVLAVRTPYGFELLDGALTP